MSFGRVAVLMGGKSAEREISLMSGNGVLKALRQKGVDAHAFDPASRELGELKREGYARCFVALHGRGGEDGSLQGALDVLGIPYTGSGVLASALAMDKVRAKKIWSADGLPTAPHVLLDKDSNFPAAAKRLGMPLFVKPASEGSSVGMTKVKTASGLKPAYALAAKHDAVVIAEKFIDGPELTAGILGDRVLPLIRIETPREFYDYQAKYFTDDTRYLIPCGVSKKKEQQLQTLCLRAFRSLGCRGWGRVDLMLDRRGRPFLLEINTAPGMTSHSLVPMAAKAVGISYADLCVAILEAAHVG